MVVDDSVRKFERVSGAILSRSNKCKIIGFGNWKKRCNWPLQYVKSVEELKVFGIFIRNSFQCMAKRNWNYRFEKFQQSLFTWSFRALSSLYQRVEVINTFALSRIYYIASILPMQKCIIRKIEHSIGKFLWPWSGRVLRVALKDVMNRRENGGLGLVCAWVYILDKNPYISNFRTLTLPTLI